MLVPGVGHGIGRTRVDRIGRTLPENAALQEIPLGVDDVLDHVPGGPPLAAAGLAPPAGRDGPHQRGQGLRGGGEPVEDGGRGRGGAPAIGR